MQWTDKIIIFLTCIAEIYMLYDYFNNFFHVKIKNRSVPFVYTGTVCMLFLINIIDSAIANLIFGSVLLWIFVSIMFESKIGVRFGYFVIAYAVMIGVEFLHIILSDTTAGILKDTGLIQVSEDAWQLLFIKFLNYIVFLILKQSSTKSKNRMTNRLFWAYLCVPLATTGTMLTVFYSGIDFGESVLLKVIMTAFFVFMLAGNMFFFYAFQKYTENLNDIYQQRVELAYQQAEINRLTQITELNEVFNETLHNTTHYLKVIAQLAYEHKNDEICEVVEQLVGKLDRRRVYEFCNNRFINTVLTEYKMKAEERGIDFDVYVEPGCVLEHIRDVDLITMLGNLLDNAVLAASKCEDTPYVMVRIFMQKDGKLCLIKVVNDFAEDLQEKKGKLISTKKAAGLHGLGLSSVSKIAEQYNGYLEYYVLDGMFNAVVVLVV